jgi:hypothetical protein
MTMDEQDPLARVLAAWRADIDSVSFPDLLTAGAAVAVVAAAGRGDSVRSVRRWTSA